MASSISGCCIARESLAEAVDWLDAVFGRRGGGFLDARGPWLGLLFLGLVVLARPLSGLLPVVAPIALGMGLPWRRLLPVAVAPAVLTPLILWKLPTDFLPILLGDYLTVHFALYGGSPRRACALPDHRHQLGSPLHAHGGSWLSPSWPWPPTPFWSSACRSIAT